MIEPARFILRLGAVPENEMRVSLWREAFDSLDADALYATVREVIDGMERHRRAAHQHAYHALVEYLSAVRGQLYPPLRALYEAAHEADDLRVKRLLLTLPAAREIDPRRLEQPLINPDRDVTLGERRTLARSRNRDLLARMIYDADPGVIQHLLANPLVTQYEVLKIASRRPNSAEVLSLLFRHRRWGRRREVQRSLAFNPYTPGDIALSLVTFLEAPDLRSLANDRLVHPAVRARAIELLAGRDARREEPAEWPIEDEPVAVEVEVEVEDDVEVAPSADEPTVALEALAAIEALGSPESLEAVDALEAIDDDDPAAADPVDLQALHAIEALAAIGPVESLTPVGRPTPPDRGDQDDDDPDDA